MRQGEAVFVDSGALAFGSHIRSIITLRWSDSGWSADPSARFGARALKSGHDPAPELRARPPPCTVPPACTDRMGSMTDDDPLASFRLDDRLIVVTGASQGIGRALAEGFARAGAVEVLASRRPDKLEEVRAAPSKLPAAPQIDVCQLE
jgi:hypothetical protein